MLATKVLKRNAADPIVYHNHTSGTVDAFPEGILVTRQIVEVGKLLDTEVLDPGQGSLALNARKGIRLYTS